MKTIRKINDELAIAGQITPEQLQQIAQEGFKSVLNLRSPTEDGFLIGEQSQCESLGLYYVNIPIKLEAINDEIATRVFRAINELPKPILIHCSSAKRSAALVLMYIAMRQGATFKQAFSQAEQLGLFAILTYS